MFLKNAHAIDYNVSIGCETNAIPSVGAHTPWGIVKSWKSFEEPHFSSSHHCIEIYLPVSDYLGTVFDLRLCYCLIQLKLLSVVYGQQLSVFKGLKFVYYIFKMFITIRFHQTKRNLGFQIDDSANLKAYEFAKVFREHCQLGWVLNLFLLDFLSLPLANYISFLH